MIEFEKWHGNGNDFVIVNSIEQELKIKKSFIKKISDRNKGIGFDQLIHIGLPTKDQYSFFVRFYNSDGSEAGMCLNGIRCAASYIWKNKFMPISNILVQTKYMDLECIPKLKGKVSVLVNLPSSIQDKNLEQKINKKIKRKFFLSNIGNNHLCIELPSIEKVDLDSIYQELYKIIKDLDINLSIFSKSKEDIHIRTYENGTGETLSCGSAALCVASKSLTRNKVKVISMGGELSFKANKNGILMTGPSNFIYQGATNE